MRTLFRLSVLALAFIAAASPAGAFKMTPIEVKFEPAGSGAARTVLLENQTDTPSAVELTTHKRTMLQNGEDVLEADEDSFLVVPSQVILMPGQQQVVRVQWLGGPVTTEQAFRLIAEQLPIELEEGSQQGGRMRLLVRYIASLYVAPAGARPDMTVNGGKIIRTDANSAELLFQVKNSGSAHLGLSDLTITVRPNGPGTAASLTLPPAQLDGTTGAVVLAGHTRDFRVPLAAPATPGPVHVDLDYTAR